MVHNLFYYVDLTGRRRWFRRLCAQIRRRLPGNHRERNGSKPDQLAKLFGIHGYFLRIIDGPKIIAVSIKISATAKPLG
jgi:hypothetical protein